MNQALHFATTLVANTFAHVNAIDMVCNFVTLKMNRLKKVITVDKEVRFGQPVFKGTRVPVYHLFDYLWTGSSFDDFTKDFPSVSKKQAEGAISIASEIFYSGKLATFYETLTRRKSSRWTKTTSKRS